ncbi:Neogenin [Actinoplanes sp. NPDC051494]|uniref:Neogenin n=1 Tax=Actinoplanes sp. NPDC051494 TaxID=3363907 RepID=UPI00379FD550
MARGTDDVRKINVGWKTVTDADHYVVDFMTGDVETVINVPASTTSYVLNAPDECAAYKIRVGAADKDGNSTLTSWWAVKSLAPGYVSSLSTGREDDGSTAVASWKVPSSPGLSPVTGYHVVFARTSDGTVLRETTTTDTSFRYAGVEGARTYSLSVTALNDYGSCLTAKSTMMPFKPADPTGLVVKRRADSPGTVEVVWDAATTGPTPTYYMLNYGEAKITGSQRVDASATSGTLKLDLNKSWMIELKAYNSNGGSGAATGSVPIWTAPVPVAEPIPATDTPATDAAATPDPTQTTTSTTVTTGSDKTPPVITTTLSAVKKNGWFNQPVTVHFACSDEGGIAKCPTDVTLSDDGLLQRVTGTAVDTAGNTTTTTLQLSVDKTAPTISAAVIGVKNAAGWYTAPPTIHYTCADNLALSTCPADSPIRIDAMNQKLTGTALDKAGNTATATVTVNLDQLAPVITATVLGELNTAGWYKTPPTVHFECADAGSGIASCPADRTLAIDTIGQKVVGTAFDVAGNAATATVALNLDQTGPVVTASISGDANATGWYKTAPTVHFSCSDEGSGIATCPADVVVATGGAAQTVLGTAVDNAGNTGAARVILNVDPNAPTITAEILGKPNAEGWYRAAPTVHFTCSDDIAGIADCPTDVPVTADGAGQLILGSATDGAGNVASTSISVNMDQTAPSITATIVGEPTADGWYKTAPTVHFTCTDEGSGLAECPADVKVATDGAMQRITGTAVDKAGNPATAGVNVSVDLLGPEISATVDGRKNDAGWYNAAPTVHFTCSDNGSAVASCPADVVVGTEGLQIAVPGTATDKAGNSTTTTATVNIDKTAPVVSVLGAIKGAVYGTEANPSVSCRTTDDGAGVATQATMTHTSNEKGLHTIICAGAVDKAGNTAAPVTITYTVETSVAWLIALTHQYLPSASAATLKDIDANLNKHQFLIYIAKVLLLSAGKKASLTSAQATTLIYWAFVLDRKY